MLLVACAVPGRGAAAQAQDTLFIVQHGWHPGLLIPLPLAEPLRLGPLAEYPARYLDVGWGDAGYYPNPNPGLWTLLRAALWPTDGVVQIVAFDVDPAAVTPEGPVFAVPIPDSLRRDLISFVIDEIQWEDGEPIDVAPSLYGQGRFFAATRRYHMFNNSNQWAARALRRIGCDVSVWQSLTIELLFQQVTECGEVVRDDSSGNMEGEDR